MASRRAGRCAGVAVAAALAAALVAVGGAQATQYITSTGTKWCTPGPAADLPGVFITITYGAPSAAAMDQLITNDCVYFNGSLTFAGWPDLTGTSYNSLPLGYVYGAFEWSEANYTGVPFNGATNYATGSLVYAESITMTLLDAVPSLYFPLLASAGSLTVSSVAFVSNGTISMPSLGNITGTFEITGSLLPTTCAINGFAYGNDFVLTQCIGVATLSLPSLVSLSGSLVVTNATLTDLSAPLLKTVAGRTSMVQSACVGIYIAYNANFCTIGRLTPQLRNVATFGVLVEGNYANQPNVQCPQLSVAIAAYNASKLNPNPVSDANVNLSVVSLSYGEAVVRWTAARPTYGIVRGYELCIWPSEVGVQFDLSQPYSICPSYTTVYLEAPYDPVRMYYDPDAYMQATIVGLSSRANYSAVVRTWYDYATVQLTSLGVSAPLLIVPVPNERTELYNAIMTPQITPAPYSVPYANMPALYDIYIVNAFDTLTPLFTSGAISTLGVSRSTGSVVMSIASTRTKLIQLFQDPVFLGWNVTVFPVYRYPQSDPVATPSVYAPAGDLFYPVPPGMQISGPAPTIAPPPLPTFGPAVLPSSLIPSLISKVPTPTW